MKTILSWLAVFAISIALLAVSAVVLYRPGNFENTLLPAPAGLTLLAALALMSIFMLRRQFRDQQRQIRQVLKSLINQDTSLSLTNAPGINPLLTQVQKEVARSHDAAKVQESYLKALITQLDVAVLELDTEDHIVQSNPAAERLLGLHFFHAWRDTLAGRDKLNPHDKIDEALTHNIEALQKLVTQATPTSQGELSWHYPNRKETLIYTLIHGFNQGQQRTLLTLQSIEKQLIKQEAKAHQQLVKVLTHEVANSITPMLSLAQSAHSISEKMAASKVEGSGDLSEALATINHRGQHLIQFTQSFKTLSEPVEAKLSAQRLLPQVTAILQLLQDDLQNIDVQINISETLEVNIDPGLFEQILINLLINAYEATHDQREARVSLVAARINDQVCLDISDNGIGISEHAAANVFVPFFTTKSGGTGVGLPLARSLMLSQGGNLLLLTTEKTRVFAVFLGRLRPEYTKSVWNSQL